MSYISKCKEYYTPAEREEADALALKLDTYMFSKENSPLSQEEFREILQRYNALTDTVEERYIASIAEDKEKILSNASEIIAAFSQRDYRRETIDTNRRLKEDIEKNLAAAREATDEKRRALLEDIVESNKKLLLDYYSFNFQSVRNFINNIVETERKALKRGGHGEAELDKMLDERAAQFYPNKDHKRTIKSEQLEAYNETAGIEQLSLFDRRFMPMLQGQLTTGLMPISTRGLQADKLRGGAAVIKKSDKHTIVINGYDKLHGELGVSAKKLLDTGVVMLTQRNSYEAENPDPVVYIDLMEYAKANGYNVSRYVVDTSEEATAQEERIAVLLKNLTFRILRDIAYISSISQTIIEKKGKNVVEGSVRRILYKGDVKNGKIRLVFDNEAAQYLSQAFIMQYPVALLKHDNRNQNSYAIGRKIAYHNSMRNNIKAGTANTLGVFSLLEAAPEIQSLVELHSKGRRDWKLQIKSKLEKALDDNVSIGYLSRWEYHSNSRGRLTREQAAELSPEEYLALYVDFAVVDPPDASEILAAVEADKPHRKRGRTKKSE